MHLPFPETITLFLSAPPRINNTSFLPPSRNNNPPYPAPTPQSPAKNPRRNGNEKRPFPYLRFVFFLLKILRPPPTPPRLPTHRFKKIF